MAIDKPTRDMVIDEATSIFINGLLTPVSTSEGVRYHMTDRITIDTILDVITDNGMIYVTTREAMEDLWVRFIDADDKRVVLDWVTQNTINWEIRAFSGPEEYDSWVQHLVNAYSRFHPGSEIFGKGGGADENQICADVEHIDRLPIDKEYKVLLKSNPWMVYLLTLQMGIDRVHKLILGGGDDKS